MMIITFSYSIIIVFESFILQISKWALIKLNLLFKRNEIINVDRSFKFNAYIVIFQKKMEWGVAQRPPILFGCY